MKYKKYIKKYKNKWIKVYSGSRTEMLTCLKPHVFYMFQAISIGFAYKFNRKPFVYPNMLGRFSRSVVRSFIKQKQ